MVSTTFVEKDRIVYLGIDRPKKRNALNAATVQELIDGLGRAKESASARVIVLHSSGTVFSAGADLSALRQMMKASDEENLADSTLLASLFSEMATHPLPIIGRIHGHAIAGGSGLAGACDIAIAVEKAKFGFTEVRLGFVPAIVLALVRTKISESILRDILLTGRLFSAAEAQQIGLISRVAADETDLDEIVRQHAAQIISKTSKSAVERTKQMLVEFRGLSLDEGLASAARHNAVARKSEDCQAGVSAFLEKRPMPWEIE